MNTREPLRRTFLTAPLMLGNLAPPSCKSRASKTKKLIEFGWDEPDTEFMRKHLAKMEQTPFDGCVFHVNYAGKAGSGNFTWECWGKRAFTMPELQASAADLRALSTKKLRHNFLRFNVSPGDLDWFDDFSAMINNASLAAKLAATGPCDGILFDIEHYHQPVFDYRKQRNAPQKSWEHYAQQVRLRGRQVIQAFQSGFPNLKVLLTYGYCLPWVQSQEGKIPLTQTEYGLLVPFLNGMLDSVKGKAKIIDGFELAYGCKTPTCISDGYQQMSRGVLPLVSDRKKYLNTFSFSFGLWVDYNWRKLGWRPDDLPANYHTPEKFEALVRAALEVADEYVWIYSETPKWWTKPLGESSGMPLAFKTALQRARNGKPR